MSLVTHPKIIMLKGVVEILAKMRGRFWLRRTFQVAAIFSFLAIVCYFMILKDGNKYSTVLYPKRSIDKPTPFLAVTEQKTISIPSSQPLKNEETTMNVFPSLPAFTEQEESKLPSDELIHNCTDDEIIHIAVVIVDCRERTSSLPLLILLKSVLLNRQLPLHLHFLSDSITNKTIHKLLSTWSIPYFNWTVYSTPQTESIPSLVYGNILLHLLLPPTVKEFIVLSIDALVINDLGQLWQSLQQHTSTRAIALNDFELNVLLTKRRSTSSILRIIASSEYRPNLSSNNIVHMFSELPMIVPCNVEQGNTCENYVISHQLAKEDIGKTIAYHKTQFTLKYNGDIPLQSIVDLKCNRQISNPNGKMNATYQNYCSWINEIAQYQYRTLLYFYGRYYSSSDKHDVTVVTQLTFDRISRLSLFLSHWTGPASIAIYVADEQLEELYNFVDSTAIISERARNNLAIHVVFNHSVIYPINYIRNVALDSVTTPYVFLDDLDLLPNYGSFLLMKKAIHKYNLQFHQKTALVIPAFEMVGNDSDKIPFPKSKQELVSLMKAKKALQFHGYISSAHKPTLYSKWKRTTKPYRVKYRSEYEPYVVVRSEVVRYDTRFVGYGWNKVSHIMELHAQKYRFVVHPFLFILHEWHPVSFQKNIFWTEEFQNCLTKQKEDFDNYLSSKYGHFKT